MSYPKPSLRKVKGKLDLLLLIKNPTEAQLKEIKWLKKVIEDNESFTNK